MIRRRRKVNRRQNILFGNIAKLLLTALSLLILRALLMGTVIANQTVDGASSFIRDHIESWILRTNRTFTDGSQAKEKIAILMLADYGEKIRLFRSQSIQDKVDYATRQRYDLIVCPQRLDSFRPATWSKLRLIHYVLFEDPKLIYDAVLWLDVDTLIWNHSKVSLPIMDYPGDIVGQRDFHRKNSLYINAGVVLFRKTVWVDYVFRQTYRQWDIVFLEGIVFFDNEQDALNRIISSSRSLSIPVDKATSRSTKLGVRSYPELWHLGSQQVTSSSKVSLVHFPNCLSCSSRFLDMYQKIVRFNSNT
jgi:hypothetical protein